MHSDRNRYQSSGPVTRQLGLDRTAAAKLPWKSWASARTVPQAGQNPNRRRFRHTVGRRLQKGGGIMTSVPMTAAKSSAVNRWRTAALATLGSVKFGLSGRRRLLLEQLAALGILQSVGGDENHIHQPPDAAAAGGEQFQNPEADVAEVEPVNAQLAQED